MSFSVRPTYATVWEVVRSEYPARVRLSTSRKDKDGNYINSNWFATFFGDAFKKINLLATGQRSRIQILRGMVEHTSVKQEDDSYRNYINLTVFDFELMGEGGMPVGADAGNYSAEAPSQQSSSKESAEVPEEYPF